MSKNKFAETFKNNRHKKGEIGYEQTIIKYLSTIESFFISISLTLQTFFLKIRTAVVFILCHFSIQKTHLHSTSINLTSPKTMQRFFFMYEQIS